MENFSPEAFKDVNVAKTVVYGDIRRSCEDVSKLRTLGLLLFESNSKTSIVLLCKSA